MASTFALSQADLSLATRLYICDLAVKMYHKHVARQALRGVVLPNAEMPAEDGIRLSIMSGTEGLADFVEESIARLRGSRFLEWHFSILRSAVVKLEMQDITTQNLIDVFKQLARVQQSALGDVDLVESRGLAAVSVRGRTEACSVTCEGEDFVGERVPLVALDRILRQTGRLQLTPSGVLVTYYGCAQLLCGASSPVYATATRPGVPSGPGVLQRQISREAVRC